MYKLKNDLMFKMVFCTKNSKENLIKFLQRIYDKNIVDIEYEPVVLEDKYIRTRKKYVDLIVKLDNGQIVNVEINTSNMKYVKARNFCYIASSYIANVKRSDNYDNINKHIQINFTWGLKEEYKIEEKYKIRNEDNTKAYLKNLEIIEYNMDKIMKGYYNNDEEIIKKYKTIIMLDLEPKEIKRIGDGDEFMESMSKRVEELNSDIEWHPWLSDEDENRITLNTQLYEAKEQGIEQTIKESAISLFKNGVSKELICKSLNMTVEKLEEYIKDTD